MLSTGFLDKIANLLTGRILLSGVLPALLSFGYIVFLTARLTDLPIAQFWDKNLTLATLLTFLFLSTLTFLFESINPLFKRWLSGDAPWFPKYFFRLREMQRRRLEEETWRAFVRYSAWEEISAELENVLRRAHRENRYSQGADPTAEANARNIQEQARKFIPADDENVDHFVRKLTEEVEKLYYAGTAPLKALDDAQIAIGGLIRSIRKFWIGELGEKQRALTTLFPIRDRVRPTKFGNIMAAIDSYAFTRYGMDAVLIWPRIRQAAKPSDDWKGLENAEAVLSFLVATVWIHVSLVAFGLCSIRLLWESDILLLLGLILGGLLGVWVFYNAALQALTAFGLQIHAALDLNRAVLLDRLRLPRPSNADEEFRLWQQISRYLLQEPTEEDRKQLWYR